MKGRVEKDCWKKNPENNPAWYKTKWRIGDGSVHTNDMGVESRMQWKKREYDIESMQIK